MEPDIKGYAESQLEYLEEKAVELAKLGYCHYFEDYVDRMIDITGAIEIFHCKKEIVDFLRPIYREHYNSRGGI